MFKIKKNHSPTHLADFFKLPPRKGLRSFTYYFNFRIPPNSTYAKSALPYCGPLPWNSLPPNLTSITSLLSFHEADKTLLFKQFVAERSQTVWNQRYTNDRIRLDKQNGP